MKRLVSIFTLAALLAVLVPSCDKTTPENRDGKDDSEKTDPTPTPTPSAKADYTILYYGIGGGNLDIGDEDTIKDMAKALDGENCNIRIITQYKYSSEAGVAAKEKAMNFKISGEPGTVYRYEITPSILAPKGSNCYLTLPKDSKFAGADYKMFAPENISSFIKYAVEKAPASQYLFFVTGHGDGYDLAADIPLTKTTATDENFEDNPGISMYQIKEGIRQSGVQLALLGYQSCEMGQIEVISELQGAASYIMASGHTISDFGYTNMIEAMRDGDPFKTALEDLVRGSLNENLPQKGGNANFHVTDMEKLPAFLGTLKEITTYLCANKLDNEKGYLAAAAKTYQYDEDENKFDLYDYLYFLGKEVYSKDQNYLNLLEKVKAALEQAQPIHYNSLECKGDKYYDNLSYSVCLGAQGYLVDYTDNGRKQQAIDKKGTIYSLVNNVVDTSKPIKTDANKAWDKTYNLTTFDKTVGWSKWFAVNPAFPRNNPPFYIYQTPDEPVDDDDDDEGDEGDE